MNADKLKGGLYGLLIGDALGVPFEFKSAREIPVQVSFNLPEGFKRSHEMAPKNAWSDDGALALCLLESLLDCNGFEADDFAANMLLWGKEGRNAVDGVVFDIGRATMEALDRIDEGLAPLASGTSGEDAMGNGSLMRVLPVALWCKGSDDEVAGIAMAQSRVTHYENLPVLISMFYALWAKKILQGEDQPYFKALLSLEEMVKGTEFERVLDYTIKPRAEPEIGLNRGYVLDTFNLARKLMGDRVRTNYNEAVTNAIRWGGDTDTAAAVVGGLAGLKYGFSGIDNRFKIALAGKDIADPICTRLLAHHANVEINPASGELEK